ncbi:ABC transporter permease [Bacillus thuringiensis]|uniref:ABC transporter permease n=1 Tax=Bacillus thuringiensis TaxID=1428 RepID=UPI0011A52986|nr:ABC transporter permease [Bacillus thuringiensis]
MMMRMDKWCGISGLELVGGILCIIWVGGVGGLFKGLEIDLMGFWKRIVFVGGKLVEAGEIR